MTNRVFPSLTIAALMLGGSSVACADGGHVATSRAERRAEAKVERQATADAASASKAIEAGEGVEAVDFAERATAARPRRADYRTLLGQSYLKAGRFASARAAFADALTLGATEPRAALDLALVQIALGDVPAARATLVEHQAIIPAADLGLAVALAGDPAQGVTILTAAARSARTDVKTRQNLALALALDGRWAEARAVAATDVNPGQLDARMEQWARFVRPTGASDQVATLLGVKPAADAGQPVALALVAPAPVRVADLSAPAADAPLVDAPALPAPRPTLAAWAAPRPVVQPLPTSRATAPAAIATRSAAPVVVVRRHAEPVASLKPSQGGWYVQVGAFRNASLAEGGWAQAVSRAAVLRGRTPQQASFRTDSGVFTRLSVGGFSHDEAVAACRTLRAHGGACFVRTGAGEQIAAWARKDVQVASHQRHGVEVALR